MRDEIKHGAKTFSSGGTQTRARRGAALRSEEKSRVLLEKRAGASIGAAGRSVENTAGSPTGVAQPADKSYKADTYRLHWKGTRDTQGRTSGNIPHIGSRDEKGWTKEHDATRKRFGEHLGATVPGITNPFGSHLAENSHVHAGSLFGPNDILSAPPASIHQNTEWLAIESGIKHLQKKSSTLGGELRIKSTGYVHAAGPLDGTLKSARYKIYIDSAKVFDHVSFGGRGNIDKDESAALLTRVKALNSFSPAVSLHGTSAKGVHGTAPSIDDARRGQRSGKSISHPQFTDLTAKGVRYVGQAAFDFAKPHYKK